MKCLIIAAGKGQRLSGCAESKPLLQVGGRPLIDWVILSAGQAGIKDFVVVTGFAADKVESHLQRISLAEGLNIECVRNDEWEKENGLSVYKAARKAGDRFILSMSDHIFDPETLRRLMNEKLPDGGLILAVDLRIEGNPLVDLDDVTKVLIEDGKISAIGKAIETYNAFDTGLFFCSGGLFQALEESQRKGDFTLSGGVKRLAAAGRALVMDVDGRDWIDVDDPAAVRKAEALVAARI